MKSFSVSGRSDRDCGSKKTCVGRKKKKDGGTSLRPVLEISFPLNTIQWNYRARSVPALFKLEARRGRRRQILRRNHNLSVARDEQ